MAAAVRRQSSGRRLSGWRPEDVENLFDENDDDAEKRRAAEQKQEEAERKAQHARSPYRETPRHQARTALLTDMYSDCIQLCAENKVNEKNSWTLDLIDHMGRMIGEPVNSGDESMTNFQLASSTLDAGVKIYAYRVDSVYTETFKLMGGLNRTSKKGDDEAIAEEACANENDGDVRADCATQKKERKRPVSSSIEANPSQLNMKKLELAFEIDPLFHRTSAKFDEGGAKGLLLHNLPVRNGCELVLDSSDPCGAEKLMPATEIPLCGIIDLIPTGFDSMHICEELATLADPVRRADDLTLASEDPCNDADEGLDVGELATGDVDADVDLSDDHGGADALVWQADGETDADGGDGGVDNGADYDAGSESALDLAGDAEGEAREAAFQSRLRMLSEAPQGEAEFGAFEELDRTALSEATPDELLQAQAQQLLNAGHRWAGPSHWKFRAAPRPVSELAKKGAGKAAKPLFVVDFGTRRQCQEALLGMAVDPKGAVLARANLVKANGAAITLPKDCLCSLDVFTKLFNKPQSRVRRVQRRRRQKLVAETQALTEEAEDADWGCAGDLPPDNEPDWGDAADGPVGLPHADAAQEDAAQEDGGASELTELVAAPQRAQKISIEYAKSAKQVDIKGLKLALWELLNEALMRCDLDGPSEVSFQDVIAALPEKLSAHKLADISCAYCFICLLHLANEKSLEVRGTADMADMRVSAPAL